MPIYEYRCAVCGHQFTLLLPMSQSDAQCACPACGAAGARRLISSFAAIGGTGSAGDCGPVG